MLGWCGHTTVSRLRLSDRPVEFPAPARSVLHGTNGSLDGSASTGPGVLNGAYLWAQASVILDALSRTNCTVTISRIVIRRLHRGGRARPACPRWARRRTAPPLARAAGLRGPARAHWICPVPLFPRVRYAIRATCTPVRPGRIRPGAFERPYHAREKREHL